MGEDYRLDTLNRLEELKKELEEHIYSEKIEFPTLTLSVSEARWVSGRLYDDVERGIYKVRLNAQKSPHSVELTPEIMFYGAAVLIGSTVISSTVNYFIEDLLDFLKRKWNRKKKKDSTKRATTKRATTKRATTKRATTKRATRSMGRGNQLF